MTEMDELKPIKGDGFEKETGGFSFIFVGGKKFTADEVRAALSLAGVTDTAVRAFAVAYEKACNHRYDMDAIREGLEAATNEMRKERNEAREANEALMAERTGLIETKRQQLAAIEKERDEVREALDRANSYLQFVARWAWRESEGLTDEGRLSAIKFYPPIKALAAGEPAPLSLKGKDE